MKEGVLICDCGGGTVVSLTIARSPEQQANIKKDLTAYTVVNDDPLELAECCVGDGATLALLFLTRHV